VPGQRLRMNALGGAVVVSKSGLTSLVDRMEEAGLISREPDPHDRRAIDVVLTQKGAERFQAAAKGHRRRIRDHFVRHLTEKEGRELAALLGKLKRTSAR
jgi:DNA-binding MarR family transcriptional regulator